MDPKVVTQIYASLQGLEKSFSTLKELHAQSPSEDIEHLLPQQEEILAKMRQCANFLQFEVARKDTNSAVRTLKIYYGLHNMVRSQIISAQSCLSRGAPFVPARVETRGGTSTTVH
jgi:hypothetical protein